MGQAPPVTQDGIKKRITGLLRNARVRQYRANWHSIPPAKKIKYIHEMRKGSDSD